MLENHDRGEQTPFSRETELPRGKKMTPSGLGDTLGALLLGTSTYGCNLRPSSVVVVCACLCTSWENFASGTPPCGVHAWLVARNVIASFTPAGTADPTE